MKKTIIVAMMAVCSMSMQAQFSGKGSGTEKDPYQITNADELFEVRNDLNACYKVMNDIDLGVWIQEESPNQGWNPVGTEKFPFSGTFDGNNKCIIGLYINKENSDNVGLFGYIKKATIKNICLVNPKIIGNNYVGAVVGRAYNLTRFDVVDNCCIGGNVTGKESVGGIVGGGYFSEYNYKEPELNYIQGNYSSSKISGNTNVGGIVGYLYNECGLPCIYDNHFCGKIEALNANNVGGIVGRLYNYYGSLKEDGINWTYSGSPFQRNLVGGSIFGSTNTNGMGGLIYCINQTIYQEMNNNVCYVDTLSGVSPKRIASVKTSNNYGLSTMLVLNNGKVSAVEDDDYNGSSLGHKTLLRRNTYVGMGFDFTNQWNIKEGETMPYNKRQSEPGQVTEFTGGSRGKISGKADGSGNVFVFVGDIICKSFIVDGQWEVTLGNIPSGTTAKVSVATNGLMPSIFVTAIAEGCSTNPTKSAGDANGDGVVDSADVTAIINYILGKPSASFNKENADVTGDGEILIDDAVQTVQLIMNAQ